MPGQPGDLLDADPAMAHQAHERGPQLTWRPVIADARRFAYPPEHLPDVPCIEGGAEVGCEVLPPSPGRSRS